LYFQNVPEDVAVTNASCNEFLDLEVVVPTSSGQVAQNTQAKPFVKLGNHEFQCGECPKVLSSSGGMRYHLKVFHDKDYSPPVCPYPDCGKIFRIQKYLDHHIDSTHNNVKNHLCDLCGKSLSTLFSLKIHKLYHADRKDHSCQFCGLKFRTIGRKNIHEKIHGAEKKFVCEVCSRPFLWKKSWRKHMLTHSGERPFKCDTCHKGFSCKWNLQQHARIHSNLRPYVCEWCGKAFTINQSLKEHRAKYHPQHLKPEASVE